jgi:hypothetical protein
MRIRIIDLEDTLDQAKMSTYVGGDYTGDFYEKAKSWAGSVMRQTRQTLTTVVDFVTPDEDGYSGGTRMPSGSPDPDLGGGGGCRSSLEYCNPWIPM